MHKPALAVVVAVLASGCERGTDGAAPYRPAPSASVAPLPIDHLAPGELAEGPEKAFGLAIPRTFRVGRRFDDSVFASGAASPETVANYVRRRIEAEAVEIGPTRTIFVRARVKGVGPNSPLLRVEVSEGALGAELVVRNITPAPVVPDLTEEERWKREGLTPQGKVLDPSKTF